MDKCLITFISLSQTNLPQSRDDLFSVSSHLIGMLNFIQIQGAHPDEIYTFFFGNLLLPSPASLVKQVTMDPGERKNCSHL